MPTFYDDAALTPEELRLKALYEAGQPTGNTAPAALAPAPAPPSENQDLAAALQRASYDPNSSGARTLNAFQDLAPGQGVAVGPNGFATMGMTAIPANAPPDYRGNIAAPSPEQVQEAEALRKAQEDAQRLSSDVNQQRAYVDATKEMMEYQHRTQKGEKGFDVFADIMRRKALRPGGTITAGAMEKLLSTQAFVPQTMTLPGGQSMIQTSPNNWRPAPAPKLTPEEMTAQEEARTRATTTARIETERALGGEKLTEVQKETLRDARSVIRDFEKRYPPIMQSTMLKSKNPDFLAELEAARNAANEIAALPGAENDALAKKYLTRTPPATSTATAGAKQQVPTAAIQYLKQHPEMRADFERKYGKGSAAQYLK